MIYQCGYIHVNPITFKREDCTRPAKWISPERLLTSGRLKVCDQCKDIMKGQYERADKPAIFEPLFKMKPERESVVLKEN